MNSRFNDEVVELLVLSFALDPRDNHKAFCVEDICKFMNDFYLNNFMEQDKLHMKIQLEHFQLNAHQSTEFHETCEEKAPQQNGGCFLLTYLVAYIEKEIAGEFSTDFIIDEFDLMKKRRVQFKMFSIEK
ncbi:hypothetical protein V6Z11_A05G463500 [Gossypium hirsutum]